MNFELRNLKSLFAAMGIPFLIGIFFFLSAWQSTNIVRIQRKIYSANLERQELERENEELRISILTETSAEKVDKIYSRYVRERNFNTKARIIILKLPRANGDSFETQ